MKATTGSAPITSGRVLRDALSYDMLMRFAHFGREGAMRDKMLALARLGPTDAVLDVGCGTGTLAIAAKKAIGAGGSVHAIDASPEMLVRAHAKARKQHVDVVFENAAAEALPFHDARFDVVLCTIMLHHLPRTARARAAHEIRRVLKPGGRAVIVDFQDSGNRHSIVAFFRRHRHGHVKMDDMLALLREAGFTIAQSGPFRKPNLYFVIAAPQAK